MKHSPLLRLFFSIPIAVVVAIAVVIVHSAAVVAVGSSRAIESSPEGGNNANNNIVDSSHHLRARNEIQPAYCYGVGDYTCYKLSGFLSHRCYCVDGAMYIYIYIGVNVYYRTHDINFSIIYS